MSERILLVESDASISQTLGRVLEMEDHEVVLAQSGRKAISKFLREPSDLILLDLDSPDEDGWEAIDQMEQMRPFVPILVITSRPGQLQHASEVGIDALMQKPLDLPLLLRAVDDLLAEPEPERLARLTRRSFTTQFLTAEDLKEVKHVEVRDWGINE